MHKPEGPFAIYQLTSDKIELLAYLSTCKVQMRVKARRETTHPAFRTFKLVTIATSLGRSQNERQIAHLQ